MTAGGLVETASSKIYHDIYDFSMFPVSLGDILTWSVKSALRASNAGRSRVHIHVICDPKTSGFSPLQSNTYLVDLLVAEAMPAFYSHPYFSGITIYKSRDDFKSVFSLTSKEDAAAREVFEENALHFSERNNFDKTCAYFNKLCSYHEEINEHFRQKGSFPMLGYLKDCLIDWQSMRSQFPEDTFWVTMQFRFRKLDTGMPVEQDGILRDASFVTWYNFLKEAQRKYPSVRFITLGRLQEKPLELLRLPNVTSLRTLGMNLSHELAVLLSSDLYLGSPSGFAQAAHFSEVPYDIFNCTPLGCKLYGIPYESEKLVHAVERQRLHYGIETTELLMETLTRALRESAKKATTSALSEIARAASTDRFFISEAQNNAELANILQPHFKAIASRIESGNIDQAWKELDSLRDSFPRFVEDSSDFAWLDELIKKFRQADSALDEKRVTLLMEASRYCHPGRLIRSSGRHFDNLFVSTGFRRDGWCEQKTRLVFAPSNKGDFLAIRIRSLAEDEPTGLTVQINDQAPVPFVLLNEFSTLEVPITQLNIPTEVLLTADRSFKINSQDVQQFAFQLEGAGIYLKQKPTLPCYRGDKRSTREKVVSGIYSNGMASNLACVRVDNPLPAKQPVMVRVTGTLPRSQRKGQCFRIQINNDLPHEGFLSGKHFSAEIPCQSSEAGLTVRMQFWDQGRSENEPTENRAMISSVDVLPAARREAIIRAGTTGAVSYVFDRLKDKLDKKLS